VRSMHGIIKQNRSYRTYKTYLFDLARFHYAVNLLVQLFHVVANGIFSEPRVELRVQQVFVAHVWDSSDLQKS
jgi:hypothetical protein